VGCKLTANRCYRFYEFVRRFRGDASKQDRPYPNGDLSGAAWTPSDDARDRRAERLAACHPASDTQIAAYVWCSADRFETDCWLIHHRSRGTVWTPTFQGERYG
jgi:hypothetical protein